MKLIISLIVSAFMCLGSSAQTFSRQLLQRAEDGDVSALCDLAWCYYDGSGVKKDALHALQLFEEAARRGSTDAMCYAAEYYEEGARDYGRAFYWYEKAAQKNYKPAFFTVGVWYYYGQGVEYDPMKAYYWFKKGADTGSAGSMYYIAVLYDNGEGVAQDFSKSYRWFLRAALHGDVMSYHYLGTYYEYGIGVRKNLSTAKTLYKAYREAEAGHSARAKEMLLKAVPTT